LKKSLQFENESGILGEGFAVKAMQSQFKRKEVNKSNEGRYPSQLSADYDQMRLR